MVLFFNDIEEFTGDEIFFENINDYNNIVNDTNNTFISHVNIGNISCNRIHLDALI